MKTITVCALVTLLVEGRRINVGETATITRTQEQINDALRLGLYQIVEEQNKENGELPSE
jgi:hypothetical protein